jgi:O-acetylhomoserine/O-acetylserine sulfhydrylase-like pyridoxal-dependent enzyme
MKNLVLKLKPSVPIRTHPIFRALSTIVLNSSFVFEDAEDMRASFAEEKDRNIYSRYSNPNTMSLWKSM